MPTFKVTIENSGDSLSQTKTRSTYRNMARLRSPTSRRTKLTWPHLQSRKWNCCVGSGGPNSRRLCTVSKILAFICATVMVPVLEANERPSDASLMPSKNSDMFYFKPEGGATATLSATDRAVKHNPLLPPVCYRMPQAYITRPEKSSGCKKWMVGSFDVACSHDEHNLAILCK